MPLAAMWTLYEHTKGGLYLGLGPARHSETEEELERYLCLQPSSLGAAWVRPRAMFHERVGERARFEPVARVRVAMPEDEPTLLAFGFDAWGEGRTLEAFVASYASSQHHLRGTRYLVESLEREPLADLNTLRFRRGFVGIASVATAPAHRKKGHATRLLRAVLALFRDAEPNTRFGLFSEVDPRVYQAVGFERLPDDLQRFLPSIAMATGLADRPLDDAESTLFTHYF
jgi:GNAT superfamily N-acetyltransferase